MKGLAIMASGAGSNAERIIRTLNCSGFKPVKKILTNKAESGVVKIAARHNVPVEVVSDSDLENPLLIEQIESMGVELIVLAGFLRKVPTSFIDRFSGEIINIHPSLLPLHGGKGMYGERVHKAVIQSGERTSGMTVHHVNSEYDKGEVIAQFQCRVLAEDTYESLSSRVRSLEHTYYPIVIKEMLLS